MRALEAGKAPARLRVEGSLNIYTHHKTPLSLTLPAEELIARSLYIDDASLLTCWPRFVRCQYLHVSRLQLDFPPDSVLEIIAPTGMQDDWDVRTLHLQDCPHITHLPELRGELLHELNITNCPQLASLPANLRAGRVTIERCPRLSRLPDVIYASGVSSAGDAALAALPDDTFASETLDLSGSSWLTRLPENIEAQRLNIAGCRGLTAMPAGLRALYINMERCENVTRWDDPNVVELRQLSARGCAALESLPPNLRQIDELDISGCVRLTSLPAELRVTRWVDVGGSGVRALPPSARGAQVRWNGVNVTGQIAFHPETLTAHQALTEENVELRRVMLERIRPERFMAEAQPQELDADVDAEGARRLLRVNIAGDEPMVALQVSDPSTGRTYLLRVPPTMDTCRRAAAWIAGFDDPDDYNPVMET